MAIVRESGTGTKLAGEAVGARWGSGAGKQIADCRRRRDDERKRDGKEEDRDKGRRRDGDVVRPAQGALRHAEKRLDDDHEHGGLDAEKGRFHQRDLAEVCVSDGEREHDRGTGQHEEKAGGETADRPVEPPADVSGELHRLGAGKQHAKVKRMQEALFRNPAPLIDDEAMHQGDLSGGAAEGQEADFAPERERLGKAWLGLCLGLHGGYGLARLKLRAQSLPMPIVIAVSALFFPLALRERASHPARSARRVAGRVRGEFLDAGYRPLTPHRARATSCSGGVRR